MRVEQARLRSLEQEQVAARIRHDAQCDFHELQILKLEKLSLNPQQHADAPNKLVQPADVPNKSTGQLHENANDLFNVQA
eukprot:7804486-Heterocapsa_arctica.AAC.2